MSLELTMRITDGVVGRCGNTKDAISYKIYNINTNRNWVLNKYIYIDFDHIKNKLSLKHFNMIINLTYLNHLRENIYLTDFIVYFSFIFIKFIEPLQGENQHNKTNGSNDAIELGFIALK